MTLQTSSHRGDAEHAEEDPFTTRARRHHGFWGFKPKSSVPFAPLGPSRLNAFVVDPIGILCALCGSAVTNGPDGVAP